MKRLLISLVFAVLAVSGSLGQTVVSIPELTALSGSVADGDLLPIHDLSTGGKNFRKLAMSDLKTYMSAAPTITGNFSWGTAGVRVTNDGDGAITFLGLGDGSDEDLTLNLDDTANTWVWSSSTGVTLSLFSGVSLQVSASNPFLVLTDSDTGADS